MAYIQKFPSLTPLQVIADHRQIPVGSSLLDSMPYKGKLFSLVRRGDSHLSILTSETYTIKDGSSHYYCNQHDYPLKVLVWFPKALEEFRKPPAQGGLHAGAMITDYIDVDGEMLTLGRTTEGYALTNWSRCKHGNKTFAPIDLALDSEFLYQQGFLQLWQSLSDRYKQGSL
jgi:hypothetical protein